MKIVEDMLDWIYFHCVLLSPSTRESQDRVNILQRKIAQQPFHIRIAQEKYDKKPNAYTKGLLDFQINKLEEYQQQLEGRKTVLEKQMKTEKMDKDSIGFDIELIFHKYKICRQQYHGGSFTGVHCIRIMGNCEDIMREVTSGRRP